jgi:hypothetical protein
MVEFTQTHYISSYVKDDHLTYIGCTCGWMTVSPNRRAIQRWHKHRPTPESTRKPPPSGIDPIILRTET